MEQFKIWVKQYGVIAVIALGGLGFIWWQGQSAPATNDLAPVAESGSIVVSSSASSNSSSASSIPQAGYVEIKGAVAHPGLYPVDGSTTRWDAIVKAAGGLASNADASTINLAAVAHDQESLLIPIKGATPTDASRTPQTASSGGVTGSTNTSGDLVNLNTATSEELQTLSGVGPKKAEDIIAYRDANGGFQSIDDLKSVSGIGDKTFEKLAPFITVGP